MPNRSQEFILRIYIHHMQINHFWVFRWTPTMQIQSFPTSIKSRPKSTASTTFWTWLQVIYIRKCPWSKAKATNYVTNSVFLKQIRIVHACYWNEPRSYKDDLPTLYIYNTMQNFAPNRHTTLAQNLWHHS